MEVKCTYCGEKIKRSPSQIKKRNFCNKEHMGLFFTGSGNPNYGNKWNKTMKDNQRKLVIEKMNNDNIRYKCGSANRGKKFNDKRIKSMHDNRDANSYSHPHNEQSKKLIGKKSKEKFTDEYNIKFRKTMEKLNKWIPLKDKSDYEIYFNESNWIERMFDRVEGIELLKLRQYGVFSSSKNKNGMVRDHIYSRYSGFKNKIFPEILRHPCNCMLISNKENIAKHYSNKINSDGNTIDELFIKINEYNGEWKEHTKCLELIKDYNNNKRWKRGDAV